MNESGQEDEATSQVLQQLGVQAVEQQQIDQQMARRAWLKHMCGVDTSTDLETVQDMKQDINQQLKQCRKTPGQFLSDEEAQWKVQLRILERLEGYLKQHETMATQTQRTTSSSGAPSSTAATQGGATPLLSEDPQGSSFFGVLQQDESVRLGHKTPFEASKENHAKYNGSDVEEGEIQVSHSSGDGNSSSTAATKVSSSKHKKSGEIMNGKHDTNEGGSPSNENLSSTPDRKSSSSKRERSGEMNGSHDKSKDKRRKTTPRSKKGATTKVEFKEEQLSEEDDDQDFAEYDRQAQLQEGGELDDSEDNAMDVVTNLTATRRRAAVTEGESVDPMQTTIEDDSDYSVFKKRVEKFERLCEEKPELAGIQGVEGWKIPAHLWNNLFPYQKTGVRWMMELHRQQVGGIIADEMGLGKTVQVAAFLCSLKLESEGAEPSSLIVCPTTMLTHWYREMVRWYPRFRVVVMHECSIGCKKLGLSLRDVASMAFPRRHQRRQGCDAVIMTYEGFRRNAQMLTSLPWTYMILDEGHKIRNPKTFISQAVKTVPTVHRLILSGAPIQNKLIELWSLFDFVFPGRLGSQQVFEEQFAKPISAGGWANASRLQASRAYQCAVILKDLIRPYLLRRMKKDVHDQSILPPKTEQVLFCRLSSKQKELYQQFLDSSEVTQVLVGEARAFRALGILRKLCNHPALCQSVENGQDSRGRTRDRSFAKDGFPSTDSERISIGRTKLEDSGKLSVTAKVLEQWWKENHRVLLFTQGRQMLDIVEGLVQSQGWKYLRMDGTTPVIHRQQLIDQFNDESSDIFVFLLTTRVGGIGVNLTGADRVLLYDPDWNPSTDAQARERAWRLGQKRHVTIYRLICKGTIEEKIYQRQVWKLLITTRVLQNPEAGGSRTYSRVSGKPRKGSKRNAGVHTDELYDTSELKDLFTLKDDDESGKVGGSGFAQDDGKNSPNRASATTTSSSQTAVDVAAYVSEDENSSGSDGDGKTTDKAVMEALFNDSELDNVFENHKGENSSNICNIAHRMSAEAATALRQSHMLSDAQFNSLSKERIYELLRRIGNSQQADRISSGDVNESCQAIFGGKKIRLTEQQDSQEKCRCSINFPSSSSFLIGSKFSSGGSRKFANRLSRNRMRISNTRLYGKPIEQRRPSASSPRENKNPTDTLLHSSSILQRMRERFSAAQMISSTMENTSPFHRGNDTYHRRLHRAAARQDDQGRTFTTMVDLATRPHIKEPLSPAEEAVQKCGIEVVRYLLGQSGGVSSGTILQHFQDRIEVPSQLFRTILRTVASQGASTASSRDTGRPKVWKLRDEFRNIL